MLTIKKINKTHYPTRNATINNMVQTVANHLNVEPSDVFGRCRDRELVVARHVILWHLFKNTNKQYTLKRIERITKFDHSTVIHACKNVENFGLSQELPEYIELIRILNK